MSVYAILSIIITIASLVIVYKFYYSQNPVKFTCSTIGLVAILTFWVYAINTYTSYGPFTESKILDKIDYSISKTPMILTVSRLGERTTTSDVFLYKNISDTSKVEVIEKVYYNHYGQYLGKDIDIRRKEQ